MKKHILAVTIFALGILLGKIGGDERAFSEPSSEPAGPSLLLAGQDNQEEGEGPGAPQGKVSKQVLLSVGDRLRIRIYPEDEFIKGTETDVSSEGAITLPLIGKVDVQGLKVLAAERKIVDILAADYLVNPVVVIEVIQKPEAERPKIKISVLGQVQKPGTYDFSSDQKITLLQAISVAGGFTEIANTKNIKVIRKGQGKQAEAIPANADSIIAGKRSDIELEGEDVVHVGESFF